MGRAKDLIERRAVEALVGRSTELAQLLRVLQDDGPRVVFVHGIGGIGKSAVLDAFCVEARALGASVLAIDCREIEPTARGLAEELARIVGGERSNEATARLEEIAGTVVLVLDTYESFRVLDTWLRRTFVPGLGERTRIVIAGREPPVAGWSAPGWHGLVASLALGPLAEADAQELLRRAGVAERDAARINALARGHPLALTVAATALAERPTLDLGATAIPRMIAELAGLYLADVDAATRRALDAASVVRRTTVSLLRTMLPDAAPQDAYERLRALPFIEPARDGLMLHETMQQTIAEALHAADPEAHARYRRSAWRQLRAELATAPRAELWRYTADMLYLIENPVIREAFFPSRAQPLMVEPALPSDEAAISEIVALHEPRAGAELLEAWWARHPEHFRVARDPGGDVAGFYLMFDPQTVGTDLLRHDPVTRALADHLRKDPIPKAQRALFHRRRLGRADGEGSGPVQAACYLDMKRVYVEMRPALRRVYAVRHASPPRAQDALGFRPFEQEIAVGESSYHATVLDFGPASVDGWLTWLAGTELGILEEQGLLDLASRELLLGAERIPLTKLEFGVMQFLVEHAGKPVPRLGLLEHVWGYDFAGGSNVVDAVIRTLRKKLGDRASSIETVRGVGYRYHAG